MGIDATRSGGNTDKLSGYLEGYASGQKCGSEIMKMKACCEFSKIMLKFVQNCWGMEQWRQNGKTNLENDWRSKV